MEAYYRIWRIEGEESAKCMYGELLPSPISRVDMNDSIPLCAGAIKASYSLSGNYRFRWANSQYGILDYRQMWQNRVRFYDCLDEEQK